MAINSLLLSASCFTIAHAVSISLTPAASAPAASGISQVVGPSFAGLGIEPSNLFSFTGGDTPNKLSINLLQHLTDYSGAPPHLRLGGNTGDHMVWDASYSGFSLGQNPHQEETNPTPADGSVFGPGYLEALERFPKGMPVTFQLNMAYDMGDRLEKINEAAAAVVDGLNNTSLYSFEIGNEPDLYLEAWQQMRNGTWNGQIYTQQWLERAESVCNNVLKPRNMTCDFFESAQTASTIGTTFTISDLVDAGIMNGSDGTTYLSSWNQHDYFYFVDVSTYDLTLNILMDFDRTESQFAYWATSISYALSTGIPYNLREMANVGPIGMANVSNTFGAALWFLNFYCYGATLNISSVEMHMTDNSYAAPWQPIYNNGEAANVRPSYYALAAMAQLLGSGNGTTRLAPLATQNSYVRAYAAYANDDLSSLVIINAQQVNASDTDKGSIDFAISLPDLKGQTLYLSYLNADGADVTQNVTWNGLSFESDSVGTATTAQDQSGQTVVLDSNGAGTITVRDSQAVIANLGARLGSLPVDVANSTSSSGSGHSGSGSGKNGHTSSASTSGATRTVSTSASTTAIAIASTTAANVQAAAASGSVTSSSAGVSVTAKSASSKTIMLTDKTLFAVVLMALVCIFT
ncbi:glycoside hydrolase family 79 protein, partial [Aureobasidium melanogenum]